VPADQTGESPSSAAVAGIGFREFVVLIAAMMATQALAIDAMLPALPGIVSELKVANASHGQWVVTAYLVGIGVGQLAWGPVSDRFGRRPVLLTGLAFYVLAAILCGRAQDFHALLGWRLLHGLAAASAVVNRSVVRDRYAGRAMARVLSLTFVVFLMVPIIAPSFGALILRFAPWRSVFLAFAGFATAVGVWAALRLPETLHPEYRLALTVRQLRRAFGLVLGSRIALFYSLAVMVMFGALIAYVAMMPQIFTGVFHRASWMPGIFALCAASMGVGSLFNSRIVERYGMRRISHAALLCYLAIASVHLVVALTGTESVASFVVLQSGVMGCFALAAPNFGALAMEPLGAVAGVGASVQGFLTTCGGALLGAAIGRHFNSTTIPLAAGAVLCGVLCLTLVLLGEGGHLFRGQPIDVSH
jgi:MFS transporter, DHA1 family, multidrug resistance protein